jgi:hypothetical protein
MTDDFLQGRLGLHQPSDDPYQNRQESEEYRSYRISDHNTSFYVSALNGKETPPQLKRAYASRQEAFAAIDKHILSTLNPNRFDYVY